MPWLLLVLLAADTPEVSGAAMRLQGSAGRLQVAAARIAAVGDQVARDGVPHTLGPAMSDLVVLTTQLGEVRRHVEALEAAIEAADTD